MTIRPHPGPLSKGDGVRLAEVQDAYGIAHVHVTAWRKTYRGLVPDSVLDTLSVERRAEQWKNTLDDSTDAYHSTVMAEMGGRIIGFANYGREQEGDLNYQGELFAIYILKEFRGRGVGRNLVREAVAGLLTLDISSMLVWVLSGNPSRKFYEQLGGKFLREKSIQIGESTLLESAYGWRDIRPLAA